MAYKLENLRSEYKVLWDACVPTASRVAWIDEWIRTKIVANKARYNSVSLITKVPWYVIAAIHSMESSCNFKTHLHNGDPLTARTVRVPAGRPIANAPPYTWEESAVDALGYDHLSGVTDWSIEAILFRLEGYNGFGYRNRGLRSPYLWSFSNNYMKGLFVSDGKFDPDAVSRQCGAAVLLKRLVARGDITIVTGVVRPLQIGDRGEAVRTLQRQLIAHGFAPGTVDGVFGPKTEAALIAFQRAAHNQYYTAIRPTGRVDADTAEALATIPGTIKPVAVQITVSDDFMKLDHVKNVVASNGMAVDWQRFYRNGVLAVVTDKSRFAKTVRAATKPEYGNAQCAITTAAILEEEFLSVQMTKEAELFSAARRTRDEFALTHQIEIALRKLGWSYFLTSKFRAPKGAIGMKSQRYSFAGCRQHSGHVYTILEDRHPERHLIADNGGHGHVYAYETEGFWFPPLPVDVR